MDASRKFAVAKIVLDYIQLLVLVLHPSFGWVSGGPWVGLDGRVAVCNYVWLLLMSPP